MERMRGSALDELMTVLFLLLAIAAIICFFAVSNKSIFFWLAGIAIVLRIIQYALRYFK